MRLTEDKHHLVVENLDLVNKWARRMSWANRDAALDFEDFYSAGCMGLIHAASRFEPSTGLQFSTYATRCIMGYIKRHKNHVSQMHVPILVKIEKIGHDYQVYRAEHNDAIHRHQPRHY